MAAERQCGPQSLDLPGVPQDSSCSKSNSSSGSKKPVAHPPAKSIPHSEAPPAAFFHAPCFMGFPCGWLLSGAAGRGRLQRGGSPCSFPPCPQPRDPGQACRELAGKPPGNVTTAHPASATGQLAPKAASTISKLSSEIC
jgi:hypothetical protein